MTSLIAAFLFAGALLAAPAADAATVRMTYSDHIADDTDRPIERVIDVVVGAAPGEYNDVKAHVAPRPDGKRLSVVVQDMGAQLSAGNGCEPDGSAVRCDEPRRGRILESFGVNVTIALGDRDDRATVTHAGEGFYFAALLTGGDGDDVASALDAHFSAMDGEAGNDHLEGLNANSDGGDGDDVLVGGAFRDHLEGRAGADVLMGSTGSDELEGGTEDDRLVGGKGRDDLYGGSRFGPLSGAGDDQLEGEAGNDYLADSDSRPGPDLLDGGSGTDIVGSYFRRAGVRVDLSRTDGQGREGENDSFVGIEGVYGSRGDDVLLGTDGPDIIRGRGGSDRVAGLGGDDVVEASNGTVDAGEGDDRVVYPAWDKGRWAEPALSCGAGDDLVMQVRRDLLRGSRPDDGSAGPLVEGDCEDLRFSGFSLSPMPVRVGGTGKVTFEFSRLRSDPMHTLSLRRPISPFEKLAKGPVREAHVTLKLPRSVIDASRRKPVTIRAKIGGPREAYLPRIWRFQITRPQ